MAENQHKTSTLPASEIRIKRLNSDKTRKDVGSDNVYHVYFELSAVPPSEWRDLFEHEWTRLALGRKAGIDGSFLVVHCALDQIAEVLLPALKKAVAATDEAFVRWTQSEKTAREHRQDVWKQERKSVEDVAMALRFD